MKAYLQECKSRTLWKELNTRGRIPHQFEFSRTDVIFYLHCIRKKLRVAGSVSGMKYQYYFYLSGSQDRKLIYSMSLYAYKNESVKLISEFRNETISGFYKKKGVLDIGYAQFLLLYPFLNF